MKKQPAPAGDCLAEVQPRPGRPTHPQRRPWRSRPYTHGQCSRYLPAARATHWIGPRRQAAFRRIGFVGVVTRGRSSGRHRGRLHAPRTQALSSATNRGVDRGETDGQLLVAFERCASCERHGGFSAADGEQSAGAHPHRGDAEDAGFSATDAPEAAEGLGLDFIFAARLTRKVPSLCRHDAAAWTPQVRRSKASGDDGVAADIQQ